MLQRKLVFWVMVAVLFTQCKNTVRETGAEAKDSILKVAYFESALPVTDLYDYTAIESYDVAITHIPYKQVTGGENLKKIIIQHGALAEFSVQKFPNLDTLDLQGNKLKAIISLQEAKGIRYLNLSKNKLEAVPAISGMYELPNLQHLDLSSNFLRELDAEAVQLTRLATLNMSNNRMLAIPEAIGSLKNLEAVDISYNNLIGLPEDASELRHLKKIVLTGNPLAPEAVAAFRESLPETEVVFDNP